MDGTPTRLDVAELGRRRARTPQRIARRFLSLEDFARAAQRRLPVSLGGYLAGGAENEVSLRDNRAVFDELQFVPDVLVDVSGRSQQTELLGRTYAAPFGIAPMGLAAFLGYRADAAMAAAADDAGIPMIVSGSSLMRLEELGPRDGNVWFQAYVPGDRDRSRALIERVARAGYGTLVVTVDIAVNSNRENNIRNGFSSPLRITPRLVWQGISHPAWLFGTALRALATHGIPHFENSFATRGAPILSNRATRDFAGPDRFDWHHLDFVRTLWKGKLIVKGILSVADARKAVDHGVDGIILSNHGGRQLDGSLSPMRVLPETVAEVGTFPVMIDSGFRRGSDVLKALALGARFVFVGRPFLSAAVMGGEAGAAHAITLLAEEIDRNMGLLGINSLKEIGSKQVRARTAPKISDA